MIAFTHVRLYTGEETFENGLVMVDGAFVRYAGEAKGVGIPDEAQVIDGRGSVLMPGFANAHCHAAMSLLRGVGSDLMLMPWLEQIFAIEDRMRGGVKRYVYDGTRLAVMEMIRNGVTSFADMYFTMDEVALAVTETGIRANLTRGCTDKEGIDSVLDLHRDFHGAADGLIRIDMGLHAEYTSTPEVAKYASDQAKRINAGIHVHISESAVEVKDCVSRHGVTPVRYFLDRGFFENRVLAAHCVHATEEDIEILADKHAFVAHNPASNLKLGNGIAPIMRMRSKGVRVALGTDGACSNNSLDMISDMRLASLLQKGVNTDPKCLNTRESLHMATREGALAMGFDDVGLLKPGMRADLILIGAEAPNMTPMNDALANVAYAANGSNVNLTMVNGKILYRDGAFSTMDPEEVLAKAREDARLLL